MKHIVIVASLVTACGGSFVTACGGSFESSDPDVIGAGGTGGVLCETEPCPDEDASGGTAGSSAGASGHAGTGAAGAQDGGPESDAVAQPSCMPDQATPMLPTSFSWDYSAQIDGQCVSCGAEGAPCGTCTISWWEPELQTDGSLGMNGETECAASQAKHGYCGAESYCTIDVGVSVWVSATLTPASSGYSVSQATVIAHGDIRTGSSMCNAVPWQSGPPYFTTDIEQQITNRVWPCP